MRKPLNARSTQLVKSRPARERLLARTRQAVRADTPSADLSSGPRCEPLDGAYLDAAIYRRALTEMLADKIVIERHGHKRRACSRQPRRPSPASRPPSCASWRKRKRDLL